MSNVNRKLGDRKDATLCRDINGMSQICIDLKPKRSLSELYINQRYDVTNLVEYIKKYKKITNEENKITYFHAFITAIAKVIYNRPLLNRFVANRHVYEHNSVSLSFVMKTDFNDKSDEIMVITQVENDDNIFTVSDKIRNKVNEVRKKGDTGKGANDAIHILGKLPNIVRVPVVGLFKFLDQKGLLPNFLVEDNLYYSSMIISNIGTLKCGGIYHNVTDFGTCSGLITIGEIKEETVKINKKEVTRYYCEFGATIDERIADGFYMIKSLQLLQYILSRPELLEEKADEKVEN